MRSISLPTITTDRHLMDWSLVRFYQAEPDITILVSGYRTTFFQVANKGETFAYRIGLTPEERETVIQALDGATLPVTINAIDGNGECVANWVFGRNANGYSGISVVDPSDRLPLLLVYFQRGNWEIARRSFYDSVGKQVYP